MKRRGRVGPYQFHLIQETIDTPLWMEIDIEPSRSAVRIAGRGSRSGHPKPHSVTDIMTQERLDAFTRLGESEGSDMRGKPMSALAMRCVLRHGQNRLRRVFQKTFLIALATPPPLPQLIAALGRLVGPGVYASLQWLPQLEQAAAQHHPERTIYSIQPPLLDGAGSPPLIIQRAAGTSEGEEQNALPESFDLDHDIYILRLYGGYLPDDPPLYSGAILTQ